MKFSLHLLTYVAISLALNAADLSNLPEISKRFGHQSLWYAVSEDTCVFDLASERYIKCSFYVIENGNMSRLHLAGKIAVSDQKYNEIRRNSFRGAKIKEILLALDYIQGFSAYGEIHDVILEPLPTNNAEFANPVPKICQNKKIIAANDVLAEGCKQIGTGNQECKKIKNFAKDLSKRRCRSVVEAVAKCPMTDINQSINCAAEYDYNEAAAQQKRKDLEIYERAKKESEEAEKNR